LHVTAIVYAVYLLLKCRKWSPYKTDSIYRMWVPLIEEDTV